MRILLVIMLGLLTACAASGPEFQDTQLPSNRPLLVIYRPSTFSGVLATYWVEIDGKEACDIHDGSYMTHFMPNGEASIASSHFGRLGTSRLNVKSKGVVYVRLSEKLGRSLVAATTSYAGEALAEGISDSPGPFALEVVPKAEALQEIASFNKENECK